MKKISLKLLSFILIIIMLCTIIQVFFIKKEVNAALSSSYTQYVKSGINAFPESYQRKLAYLKYLHPNWEFKAYYTGIDWSQLTSTSAENGHLRNSVYKRTLMDPATLCTCGKRGDVGYYCPSHGLVNFYLDPRNFMGEAMVFQFLDLSNGTGISKSAVTQAVKGTYLAPYVDDIMNAAAEAKISPIHIVATIFQELGKKSETPKGISGKVAGYEGLYNFYNYGATDGDGAIERGLKKAKELGWTTPKFALADGAKRVLASNYIDKGQSTKYFYKFDVVGNEILTESMGKKTYDKSLFFTHQYMTNLEDPSGQAGTLYNIYSANNILDEKLTFTIPVYNNMPAKPVSKPTSLKATAKYGLFEINTMLIGGANIRSGPSASKSSYGTLYKGTIVLHLGYTGTNNEWSKVKIIQNNGKELTGYVDSDYVQRAGTDVPDYRSQVNMGPGATAVGKPDFKIEETSKDIVMTPETTLGDITKTHAKAVIKDASGKVITDTKVSLGTGYTVTIDNKTYTVVKLGDVNGDGIINSGDLLKIQKHLLNVSLISDKFIKDSADPNNDNVINSGDLLKIQKYLLKIGIIEITKE